MAQIDAPLSSLMDLTSSLKNKTLKGKGVGAHSLAPNTSGVEGRAIALGWDYEDWQESQLLTRTCINQTTSWSMRSWNTFGARTHHSPNLGEATTFPLIILFVLGHGANTQMSFCPRTPKWESQNSQNWDSRNFGAHNFMWRPLIEVRSKEKL
jgi:hypothetical protein